MMHVKDNKVDLQSKKLFAMPFHRIYALHWLDQAMKEGILTKNCVRVAKSMI